MNDDMRKLIDETKRLDQEATPGPWEPQAQCYGWGFVPCGPPRKGSPTDERVIAGAAIDARLIALSRTAAPVLAAEVERLDARLADIEEDARRVLADSCAPDERHCSCVPHLRARLVEVERERDEALLALAAEQGRQEGAPYDNPELVLAMVNGERIRRGLSWRELAAILRVSPSTLTRWTHGKMLSVPAYLRVCKWLNAAINETIDIVDANGPGWCDWCSPDRCDCEDDGAAR